MKCEICNKTFTGLTNLKQHEIGRKHLHKVELLNKCSTFKTELSADIPSLICCKVCNLKFTKLFDYQEHAESEEHVTMVTKVKKDGSPSNGIKQEIQSKFIPIPKSSNQEMFVKCDTCNKRFSGLKPYEQHLESASHKLKCENLKVALNVNSVQNSTFFCKVCNKQCNGPVTYLQHLESNPHKNKEKTENMKQESSEIKEATFDSAWLCKVCDKQCTGPVPYNQHITSKPHLKKLEGNETIQNSESSNKLIEGELSSTKACLGQSSSQSSEITEVKIEVTLEGSLLQELEKKEEELKGSMANDSPKVKETGVKVENQQIAMCETFLQQENLPQVMESSEPISKKRKNSEEISLFDNNYLPLPTDLDSGYCEYATTQTAKKNKAMNFS